ncbi:MAG: DUF7697 family protein [Janthinobacterium lividum]
MRIATIGDPAGSMSRPVGLDFGAVLAMGAAAGVDSEMLAAVLPEIEAAVLAGGDEGDVE